MNRLQYGNRKIGTVELLCAAVVMPVGGALFHPAAQSLLAGVAPARRSRGPGQEHLFSR
ncbi:hypothetical protein [Microtetraspora sp. NBRC 16547]|uniref:hypothetical protein n=1 Tax=Microtetraspora sp. NBRC 16547 TaxID=3030993 RepID=UPI0024A5FF58|nr:hypothetical protein [Microtetraspora sp. NBRC 16547]GLX00573.1 hypothetical protein Misp02_46590 [Microtetraspora sp. NBRC 16547]